MSTAVAIAGVTEVLRQQINDGLVNGGVSGILSANVVVSALPPDRVVPGNPEAPQINVFMYRVAPNTGWSNNGLPSRDSSGRNAPSHPPLALDLHYLITAYSGSDLQGDVLLGFAMQVLHETPVFTRTAIKTALTTNLPLDIVPDLLFAALGNCGLDQQVEQLRITPQYLSTEELSKLWTAMQSRYRPSIGYMVTVVLIESNKPARAPLPVLTRGGFDTTLKREVGIVPQIGLASAIPELVSLTLPGGRIVAHLGDDIALLGHNLDGSQHTLLLANERLGVRKSVVGGTNPAPGVVHFGLPDDPANYPAGIYTAQMQFVPSSGTATVVTNAISVTIAPQIVSMSGGALDASGDLTLTISCKPVLQPNQHVSLILGTFEAPIFIDPPNAPRTRTQTPTFKFFALPPSLPPSPPKPPPAPPPPPPGYQARLRVDGIDSVIVDRSTTPPIFIGPSIVVA